MKWLRHHGLYVFFVFIIVLNGLVFWQRQRIGDWWRLRDYEPSAAIAALVTNTGMTNTAQHLFYINHPALESKQGFNQHCADRDEETAVLGCYHGDRQGIYLYAVEDPRLRGVQEVTAVHEMLHQAYDRLSGDEKREVDSLLVAYFEHELNDDSVRRKIESYKKQPGVVLTNEMHSIFGSEVRDLSSALETYYKRYFKDRLKVVSLSEAYQGEFERREQLVKEYDAQLATLKRQIDTNKADVDRRLAALRGKEQEINTAYASQDMPAYRNAITSYNNQVEVYNAKIRATRSLIQQYNTIVVERNDIAVEEQELQKALDSNVAAEPK